MKDNFTDKDLASLKESLRNRTISDNKRFKKHYLGDFENAYFSEEGQRSTILSNFNLPSYRQFWEQVRYSGPAFVMGCLVAMVGFSSFLTLQKGDSPKLALNLPQEVDTSDAIFLSELLAFEAEGTANTEISNQYETSYSNEETEVSSLNLNDYLALNMLEDNEQ